MSIKYIPPKKARVNINGNTMINWNFQTISHNAFNPIRDLFLIDKYKGLTPNLIKNYLTERGLAYWFRVDGGKWNYNINANNKGLVLNIQSFTKKEVEK